MSNEVRPSDQEINLEDLTMTYRDAGRAAEAASIMDRARTGKNKIDLKVMLRHHLARTITSAREIRQRDSFDYLLAFYSILEIASLIGFVPSTLPPQLSRQFLADLKNPAVRKYYEDHYVLLLPRLARLRLEGRSPLTAMETGPEAQSILLSFLSLENRVRNDEDVEMFLWFLDDGSSSDYDLKHVLACLRDRTRFVKRMLRPKNRQDDCDTALRGFGKILKLWTDFDGLLQRCQPPLLQSALWHYYAYWFDLLQDSVGSSLREAIQNVSSWESQQTPQANKAMRRYMDQATVCVDRLLAGNYAEPLRSAANSAVAGRRLASPNRRAAKRG